MKVVLPEPGRVREVRLSDDAQTCHADAYYGRRVISSSSVSRHLVYYIGVYSFSRRVLSEKKSSMSSRFVSGGALWRNT